MKRILVAFDGTFYSDAALQYAAQVARAEKAQICGIFLEDVTTYHQFSPIFDAPEAIGVADDVIQELRSEVRQNIDGNIRRFREFCEREGISFTIHQNAGIPSLLLIDETAYADMVVIGSMTYFSNLSYSSESRLLSDLLTSSHCPVMVVPEQFEPVKHVVLAFDGSSSSTYAIRTFLQLAPDWLKSLKVSLFSVVKKDGQEVPGEDAMWSYLKLHRPVFSIEKVTGKPDEEILHYAGLAANALVVIGSFGRGTFSQMFKSSLGKQLLDARSVPIFVAHQ
jgi:nucleotide-binding universal stress UspA family protein